MSSFTLVTGGYDNSIRFFDATNQTLKRTIQFCDQQILRLAFSSDSPVSHDAPLFLIAGGSPSVAVYDVTHANTNPTLFQVHQGHTEAITAVGFEPSHSAFVFSASEDGTLQTWFPQLSAHRPIPHAYMAPDTIPSIVHPMAPGAYLPDGRMRYESVPATMQNCDDDSSCLVCIHDALYYPRKNYFFTVDYNGRFRVWDHVTSLALLTVVPHPSNRNLQCVALSTDYTTVVMANFDGFVFIYQVKHIISAISDRNRSPIPISFHANNRYIPRLRLSVSGAHLVCTTSSGAIKIFRMADITAHSSTSINSSTHDHNAPIGVESITPLREFTGQRGWIWDAAFVEDRDDYLFTCSSNMQVMLWSLNDLQNSSEYPGHVKGVVCLAVRERMSPDVRPEQFGPPPPYEYGSETVSPPEGNVDINAYGNNESATQPMPPIENA